MTERLVCLACGTVTRDERCDCNRYGAGHKMQREPRFVNFADQLLENLREEQADNDRMRDVIRVASDHLGDMETKDGLVSWTEVARVHDWLLRNVGK